MLTCRFTSSLRNLRSVSTYRINNNLIGLSEQQVEFRETIKKFSDEKIVPLASKIDEEDKFPNIKDLWLELGNMGLHGVTAPEKYGGIDLGYFDHCLAIEEISRASGSIGLSYGAHSNLCVNQIVRNGTEEQCQKYLPKLISGEHIGCLAMSESDFGSDVMNMKATAFKKGENYILNGSKFWITNGPVADVVIVYARTDLENPNPQRGISAFIVDTKSKGFSVAQKIPKLGMRGSLTGELLFEDVIVPKENLLGKENHGAYVLMSGLDFERLVLSAIPIGLMQAACDCAFDYAQTRKTFGKKISDHQMVQWLMADMAVSLSTTRTYTYSIARLLDERKKKKAEEIGKGTDTNLDTAGSILYAAENSTQVALKAIQVLGGAGYTKWYPVERILRDAKLLEIGAGTSEIRRIIIARCINQMMSE